MLVVGRSLMDAGRFEMETGAAPVWHAMPPAVAKKRNIAPNLLTAIMLVLKRAVVKALGCVENMRVGIYPEKIAEKLREKRAVAAQKGEVRGRSASFVCGCFADAFISVDGDAQIVENIRFATNGCGFMTAACAVLEISLKDRILADLNGLSDADLADEIESELGEFPAERDQCAEVAVEALKAAFAQLRQARASEFVGDSPLICTCFGVSEDDLTAAIIKTQAAEFDDLRETTRAGRGCGACRMLIDEMLDRPKIQA